jgi:CMP-N-acetylneuraminic acid synthetase
MQEFIWDDNGPINYDKGHMPRSQDLKKLYKITFSMMIIPKKLGLERKYYMGDKPFFFELDQIEGMDIDHEHDLLTANAFLIRDSLIDLYKNESQ